MSQLIKIAPGPTDRAMFVGSTGTGKTHLMLNQAEHFYGVKQIQILNTKSDSGINELDVPNLTSIDELPQYTFPEYPVVVYTPSGEELADLQNLDDWCNWCYARRNTHAIIDEITQLGNGTYPKMGLLNLATRGRDRNVSAFYGTQRPVGVPKIIYTESQHFYKFYLADLDDRKAIAKYTHPSMIHQAWDQHGFHYYKVGSRKVFYIKGL